MSKIQEISIPETRTQTVEDRLKELIESGTTFCVKYHGNDENNDFQQGCSKIRLYPDGIEYVINTLGSFGLFSEKRRMSFRYSIEK